MPAASKGTTSSPKRATSQRMGREKRTFLGPHFMFFGKYASSTNLGRISGSTSAVGRASVVVTTHTNRRPSNSLISRSGTSAPFARAKPSAALVGTPFSPKAESSAGPRCTFWRAVCSSGKSLIKRAMRRGDTRTWILSPTTSRSAEENREAALPGKRLAAARQAEAGSSSVPTSSKKSLGTSRLLQLSYVPLGYTPHVKTVCRPLRLVLAMHIPVSHPWRPFQIESAVDALQIHGYPLRTICEFDADGVQIYASYLLEIGELRDLHPVYPNLPA